MLFCLYLVVCLGIYEHMFVYHVKLIGKERQVVNIYSGYDDPGIKVKYRGKDYKGVTIDKNVDTNKIGIYRVYYSFGNERKERIVEVKDIEGPSIELKGGTIVLNIKEKYKEPGFIAVDNYDGDVTKQVIVENSVDSNKIGNYNVVYKAKDSFNNESVVKRNVIVKDKEAPIISFNNKYNTYAIVGKSKEFNDYKAFDNVDGDVTKNVKVSGQVNFNKVGIYELTYSVKDSSGNERVVKRNVNVQEKNTSGIPVLMYHWFYDDTKGETAGEVNAHNYISKTEIEKQVKYLKESNYYFPSWGELNDFIDGKIDLPKNSVIATDDDCRESFFEVAVPVFTKYRIPVTSFCITNKDNYQKYLKEEYVDFQSHTDSLHVRSCNTSWDGAVMCTPYEEIKKDIKKSIDILKNHDSFAYPFGHYNENTIKALKENDIKLAFTISNGKVKKGNDKYKLPRVRVSSWTSIEEFKNLVK